MTRSGASSSARTSTALPRGILDSFWDRPEYRRFRPPREDVRVWVRWNVDLVVRWLVDDQRPTQEDLERFRERARGLAREGMPADVVPANFRHGARYAWTALLEGAREDERPALLESADLLFEFIDRVSQLFSDTYESTRPPALVSDEERARSACWPGSRPTPLWSARTTSSPSGWASS